MSKSRKNKKPTEKTPEIELKYQTVKTAVDSLVSGKDFSGLVESIQAYDNLINSSRPFVKKAHETYLKREIKRALYYISSQAENTVASFESGGISYSFLDTEYKTTLENHRAFVTSSKSLNYGDNIVANETLQSLQQVYEIIERENKSEPVNVEIATEQPVDKYAGIKRSLKTAAAFTILTGLLTLGSYFAGKTTGDNIHVEPTSPSRITNTKEPSENSQRPTVIAPNRETVRQLDSMLNEMRYYERLGTAKQRLEKAQQEIDKGNLKRYKKN